MNTKFNTDFDYYINLISSDINFAYARYADGEINLMKGTSIGKNSQAYLIDNWQSPNTLTIVGKQLLETLNHNENNYHYAISSHSDSVDDYLFLRNKISNKNITFANLWINSNYQKMYNFYKTFDKDVFLICNHVARKENFPFKINEIFPFPTNCILYWEEHGNQYIDELLMYVEQLHNQTFFISAGPISEILIHKMYCSNPNNKYIDVGSSIDEFIYLKKTRPYMYPDSQYSTEISYFYE